MEDRSDREETETGRIQTVQGEGYREEYINTQIVLLICAGQLYTLSFAMINSFRFEDELRGNWLKVRIIMLGVRAKSQ